MAYFNPCEMLAESCWCVWEAYGELQVSSFKDLGCQQHKAFAAWLAGEETNKRDGKAIGGERDRQRISV